MQEKEFDYKEYEKSLERIFLVAEKDYWTQYVDINRHQVNVAKTYLWVSAALLGAYSAIFGKYSVYILENTYTVIFLTIGAFSATLAFGICLYAIPARKGYKAIPNESWGEFSTLSNDLLKQRKKNLYINLLTDLNNKIDKANYHNISTNQKRASLLRKTSWVLIISFIFALMAGISTSIPLITKEKTQPKEIIMSEENNSQEQPQSQSQDSQPDVPTPAGPISGGNPDMSTHSVDNSKTDTFRFTESVDKSKNNSD